MTTLIADLEADALLPDLTTIWQLSVQDYDTGVLTSYNEYGGRPLSEGLARLRAADTVVGHHFLGYDIPAIQKVFGPDAGTHENVVDTLVLSRLGRPDRKGGHSLGEWGERFGTPKVEHTEWTRWSPAMEHRCNVDVGLTTMLFARLSPMLKAMPQAVDIEHRVAWETTKMLRRGFGLDVPHCRKLIDTLQEKQEGVDEELRRLFPPIKVPKNRNAPAKTLKNVNRRHALYGSLEVGIAYCPIVTEEFNPKSRQHIARRLIQRHGWRPSQFTPGGSPEVSEDILRSLEYPEAKTLADYLVIEKKLSQLHASPNAKGYGGGWLHHVTKEGRVHANLNPNGAVSGRPTCSAPNIQNVDTAKPMRRAWVPLADRKLVGVDAAGLELRCLSHYLWPFDDGAYSRMLLEGRREDGTDVHSVVQRLIGFYDRDETKRAEYGWLYGAGDAKLGQISYQDAYRAGKPIQYDVLGITPKGKKLPSNSTVGRAIRTNLEQGITGLGVLVELIKKRSRNQKYLRGLDGRKLWVRSEHSALNLLLQSAGIIIMKQAIATSQPALVEAGYVEDRDFGMVMWIHDETQTEALPELAEPIGKILVQQIIAAGPALGFRCPLDGSLKIGDSWAETH